jgi:Uma2 family endonuclease
MVAQVQRPTDQSVGEITHDSDQALINSLKRYSPEAYLEMEVQSDARHEFRDGEIIKMTGGMPNHNRITLNIASALHFAFKGKSYEVFVTDQRLWIPEENIYTYPDVMVIQGNLELQEGRKDSIMNPLLILEVLSQSTQSYDRGDKFAAYRTIPCFQEYVLVNQYRQQIEHYVKAGLKKWNFQEYDETDTVVKLVKLDLELAIADIYDKVTFEPETVEATIDTELQQTV